MASANRDILQTAVVGVPDDNYPSTSALSPPSTLLHSSRLPPFPAHLSDNSSLPPSPSPTLSAHSSAVLDLKQEAGLDVHPFTFKPLQLASLVDPKNLETLEGLGGVDALLRGLGTHPTHGLSTEMGMPSIHRASPDPTLQSFTLSHATDEDPPKPGIMITSPAGEPQGLQSTVTLGGGSGVGLPAAVQSSEGVYRTSIEDRQRIFGQNILPRRPIRSLLQSMWLSVKDKVLVLLSICAIVSLALGLFQDFGTTRPQGEPPVDWVEGVTIIVAILIVVCVGSLNDWQKEKQFEALNEKREDRFVKVLRDGREQLIHVHNVVVGDIVLLEPGNVIPCDGVFLSGHNVRCDESSATGESDAIKKLSYQECIALRDRRLAKVDPDSPVGDGESTSGLDLLGHTDCFVVSGSKVVEGVGSYLVISVGTKSFNGRIMMALRRDSENTPLQLKLNDLAELIAKAGIIVGVFLFVSLLIRFFVELAKNPQRTSSEKGVLFVQILIIAVTVVVVAVPEGLPLAATLALAFATNRMTKANLLVRVLGSCETMANVSVICTDKGTLTQNEMTVVAGSIGIHAKFVRKLDENSARASSEDTSGPNARDFAIDLSDLNKIFTPQLAELLNASIAVNSTAFEDVDPESGMPVFVGSKTETALLKFAKDLGWANYKDIRDAANVVQMIPFSSDRKPMGCVVRLPDGNYRLFIKGASEILSRKCTRHVVVHRDEANNVPGGSGVQTAPIGELEEDNIQRTITFYASQTLRTIALCYRDFRSWPPNGVQLRDDGEPEVEYDDLTTDLTLLCITGIENPLREGVREAVAKCKNAGVRVMMCTGDNPLTAQSIAQQCNIFTDGDIIMEGPKFRILSPDVMKAIAPRLQVLARSSPEDKRILVEMLKERGDIIGVTGDGTDDGPALKTAHIGFSMGVTGTEVAKEASDIILMDDNFSSIVSAIMWGRCVNDAVRKFLQFQINTNITAVLITLITALPAASKHTALSAVQLLWIYLIMDAFAALALATDPASEALLDRKPDRKTDPLFTVNMIKQIVGQSTYLIIVILIFHFLGLKILGLHFDNSTEQKHQNAVVQTLVFNAFVFAQIWNSFNSRRLDRKLNVFEGVTKNWCFIAITSIEVFAQILICLVGGAAFQVTRMGGKEWAISLALGFVALPLGALIRLIPNEPCERIFVMLRLLPKPEVQPTMSPDVELGLGSALNRMRDNLGIFSKLRGCRMRGSSFVGSRSAAPDPDGPHIVSAVLAILEVVSDWRKTPG